ncbi:hypothetical protein H8N03_16590 [Ramlibacter sp. USB13]|uniref:Uncharacterized protein n=1 Tax=Ramlibacter cellulosilyticus TaxID=2764187 RepID=A0A923MSS6_9BURK|nr:hypothetical protein [Ramlibacter cellulosilyticus]MBC5784568.1 hypothetical protein [Ramlibacter cellulosilyticus]
MKRISPIARWITGVGTACVLALGSVAAYADAGALQGRYTELKPQLQNNSYGRQLYIDSAEGSNTLRGDVYAVLDHPFEQVKDALQDPNAWCDIMLLPFNTKGCRASGNSLTVRIGRKWNSPIDQTYPISFAFSPGAASSDYLSTRLNAGQGPFGTRDYRVNVEAVPLENGKTFMHMNYAYGYGGIGKFAMQAYLSTAGANKAGFTSDGLRGAVERNAMRYYLAIDSYLDTMDAPAASRVDKRINQWFSATERYPRQLHEMDRGTYVSMKRADYERQTTASAQ